MSSKASKAKARKDEEKKNDAGEEGADKKRAQRATSNVFAMFSKNQIQEFKEAFTMIDQNRDGFIDVEDLKDIYGSLGLSPNKKDLETMIKESPGQINFTNFLAIFGEKLHGTDPENTILQAFCMFDEDHKGFIPEEYLKELLSEMGELFSKDEIKQVWKEMPTSGGNIDYKGLTKILVGSGQDDN